MDRKLGKLRSYLLDTPTVLRPGDPPTDLPFLCDLHARAFGLDPKTGMEEADGFCLVCGDPALTLNPPPVAVAAGEHELPGPAQFDQESLAWMLREVERRAGDVPRELALRVYHADPARARAVGWAALWGLAPTPYAPLEYDAAKARLLRVWTGGDDDYDQLLRDARARCTAEQWADLALYLTLLTGVDPGAQSDS